ncbi:mitochondrial 37S ribosomal protein rsm10 [Entomortierella beljakovae]|nr:mitochondrial 37S ribosomal protein rsm10 [Entomortierella beljakovae]
MLSTIRAGISSRGLNALRIAPITTTRFYSAPTTNSLPEGISDEDRSVYGLPVKIPKSHNITVAHLHLRSYLPDQLDFFADFARRTAAALEMPCSGTIPLPVQTSKWTLNKSPFVYKKAQETFERKTHKRLLAIKDTHPDVVRRWVQFLSQNSMAGVGMRVTIWENEELGVGQKRLGKVKKGEYRNRSVAEIMKNAEQSSSGSEVSEPSDDNDTDKSEKLILELVQGIANAKVIEEISSDEKTNGEVNTPSDDTIGIASDQLLSHVAVELSKDISIEETNGDEAASANKETDETKTSS